MEALKDIVLQTNRFLLRRLKREDADELIHYSDTEPELWQYALVASTGKESMTAYIDSAISDYETGTAYPFVVIDKANGKIVGSTRYYDIQLKNGSTLLGYTWYSKLYQGSGINTHCKYMLLRHAFEELKLERIEFRADTRNFRSLAAMRKIGCVEEGILRSHLPTANGLRRDSIIFSILKHEWVGSVKKGLEKRL